MVRVTKEQFYRIIGPLKQIDSGAAIHDYPEKKIRWRLRQWVGHGYEEVAYCETLLEHPYPHPTNYYVIPRLRCETC